MEKELRERLRENEMICWQGVQADFPLLDGANRRNILMRWMVTVGLTVVVLVLHISNEEVPNSGFVGLVVLAAVMIMGAPLVEWRSLRQQQYWLTNQRAFLMTRDRSLYSIELAKLDGFQVVGDQRTENCVVLGRCIFPEARGHLRWRACHPKIDVCSQSRQGEALGMVFYCVRNTAEAATLLKSRAGNTVA